MQLLRVHAHLRLQAGNQGFVWGVYATTPATYDADFYRTDGSSVAMMFSGGDVALVTEPDRVTIPRDVFEEWRSIDQTLSRPLDQKSEIRNPKSEIDGG